VKASAVAEDDLQFAKWASRWIELAKYSGKRVPGEGERIARIVALWDEPIPGKWKRGQDPRLLDPERRYCRGDGGEDRVRPPEHEIEHNVLLLPPEGRTCLGSRLIDGVCAVPLAKDAGGGRSGNVEADMLLLVRTDDGYRLLLVEVKDAANNAWYAVVENLRQLKLLSESFETQRLFELRRPELPLADSIPVTAVVLAPADFYEAHGAKGASVAPAQRLLQAMRDNAGVDVRLATWEPKERAIRAYPAA
jgi:hypothetical protein